MASPYDGIDPCKYHHESYQSSRVESLVTVDLADVAVAFNGDHHEALRGNTTGGENEKCIDFTKDVTKGVHLKRVEKKDMNHVANNEAGRWVCFFIFVSSSVKIS